MVSKILKEEYYEKINIVVSKEEDINDMWITLGHYISQFTDAICEIIDNSVSSILSSDNKRNNIIVVVKNESDFFDVTIKDEGIGIEDLQAALTLATMKNKTSFLNEHGMGVKHSLAFVNPENNMWSITTKTKGNNLAKRVTAPYKAEMTVEEVETDFLGESGTAVTFKVRKDVFKTLLNGKSEKNISLLDLARLFSEHLGYIYQKMINEEKISIGMVWRDESGEKIYDKKVEAVVPDVAKTFGPGNNSATISLTGKKDETVTIQYSFSVINPSTKKAKSEKVYLQHYQGNTKTSGVEIAINGRIIQSNIFTEIWGNKAHDSFNHMLVQLDIISDNVNALPETNSTKTEFDKSSKKLSELYKFIKAKYNAPRPKDFNLKIQESELCKRLKIKLKELNDKNGDYVLYAEHPVNDEIKLKMDLYESYSMDNGENVVNVYECKLNKATQKNLYQLVMYVDFLLYTSMKVTKAYIVGQSKGPGLDEALTMVNQRHEGEAIFEFKKWSDFEVSVL